MGTPALHVRLRSHVWRYLVCCAAKLLGLFRAAQGQPGRWFGSLAGLARWFSGGAGGVPLRHWGGDVLLVVSGAEKQHARALRTADRGCAMIPSFEQRDLWACCRARPGVGAPRSGLDRCATIGLSRIVRLPC
jgi:hypothetical protein